jgi:predicted GNAT family N-acyltransferase
MADHPAGRSSVGESSVRVVFRCSDFARPQVIIQVQRGESCTHRVLALSADRVTVDVDGARTLLDAPDDEVFSAQLVLPEAGSMDVQLRYSGVSPRSSLWNGDVDVVESLDAYRLLAGQHLLATTTNTPSALRGAGFSFESIQRTLAFRACRTPADRMAVCVLRHVAYAAVGKVDPSSAPSVMGDRFDEGSMILMARHGERLVGTARLALPGAVDRTEYDDFVSVPSWLDRGSLAVVSRLATAAEYRGGDLLYALVLRCIAAASSAGRRFVLGGCTDALLPIYQRVGVQTTGLTFSHGSLGNTLEQLVFFDTEDVMNGRGIRPDLLHLLDVARATGGGTCQEAPD